MSEEIKRVPINHIIKQIMDEDPNRMKTYSIMMQCDGTVKECSLKTNEKSAMLAKGKAISYERGNMIAMVFARNEEQAVKLANERLIRVIKESLERYKTAHTTQSGIREEERECSTCMWDPSYLNSVTDLKCKNRSSFYGLKADNPDKPCRAMREGTALCGDLPGMAPEGKCYFDHQKDCNAWCKCWEGDKDNDKVRNIRDTQEDIKNCGLPKHKVVEEREDRYGKYIDEKNKQLDKEVEDIVKGSITKVIMASLASGVPCDPDTSSAIKYIESCLEKMNAHIRDEKNE